VNDSDVLAVLNDLTKVLKRHLSNGEIVRFGDFGSFQIAITSEGADTAEKFNASLITGGKVTFRPGVDLKEMLATLKYEKVK
jgi:predicted histone-like DNA-binding protein